jgi:hypothetical protein
MQREVTEWGRAYATPINMPPGREFFALIKVVAPGVLSKVIVAVIEPEDDLIELPEEITQQWFDETVARIAGDAEVLH